MISWHSRAKRFYFLFSCLLSLHQHMRRVSASLWRFHTTPFRLVWASRLLRASTQGPTPLIPSALTALFYLCDTDRVLWMHRKDFGSFTTGGGDSLKGCQWLIMIGSFTQTDSYGADGLTVERQNSEWWSNQRRAAHHSGKDTFGWAHLNVRRQVSEETHWM